jgi:hypothetical protein
MFHDPVWQPRESSAVSSFYCALCAFVTAFDCHPCCTSLVCAMSNRFGSNHSVLFVCVLVSLCSFFDLISFHSVVVSLFYERLNTTPTEVYANTGAQYLSTSTRYLSYSC